MLWELLMSGFPWQLELNKILTTAPLLLTPPLRMKQREGVSQQCMPSRDAFLLIDLASCLYTYSLCHVVFSLKRLTDESVRADVCALNRPFKSQSQLSKEALSIHLNFHSCIHQDAWCHLKGRNWIQTKINMINCYLFCP